MRGWKKIFQANGNQKKAGVAILISDKIDFKIKHWSRHYGCNNIASFSFHSLVKHSNTVSLMSTLFQLFEHVPWPSTVLKDSVLSWEEKGFCHHTDLGSKEGSVPVGWGNYLISVSVSLSEKSLVCASECEDFLRTLSSKDQQTVYKSPTSDLGTHKE